MCGIVGYVGGKPALEVVIDGLRRLEYRGYDSAGVALVRRRRLFTRSGRASCLPGGRPCNADASPSRRPASVTRAGRPTAPPTDRNSHPHVGAEGAVAVVHNGIIENFAGLRAELERGDTRCASETDTEVAAQLLEVEVAKARRRPRPCRPYAAGSRARSHSSPLTATTRRASWRPAATRRSSSGSATARTSSHPTSPPSSTTRVRRSSSARTRSSRSPRRASGSPTSSGKPAEGKRFHVDWDIAAAEKAGYDYFMLKEIAEQPQRGGRHPARPVQPDGRLQLDEMRLSRRGAARHRQDHHHRLRDGVPRGTAGEVRDRALGRGSRARSSCASEFRYRDPIIDRDTMVIAISQSGETMDTLMALRHARQQRAKVLAISNTNGSTIPRESDAVLYTHAGPRSRSRRRRRSSPRSSRCHLIGLYLAQVRGTKFGDEISATSPTLGAHPGRDPRGAVDRRAGRANSRASCTSARVRALPRAPRRLPGGARGCAEAQGARLHACRGVCGGRAEARTDRARRARASRCSSSSRRSAAECSTTRWSATSHEVRARGARTIVLAERGRRRRREYADELIDPADGADAAAAPGRHRSAAGLLLRDGDGARARRRPAAQPGQVRHGRVGQPR